MSLRTRINLLITALMLAFAAALTALEINDARQSIKEEIEAGTKVSAQLLAMVARHGRYTPEAMLNFLHRLGRVRANDISLYDLEGTRRYNSPPSTYKAGRNAPAWFAKLVAPAVTAVRLDLPYGSLVITPDVSRSVLDAWDELKALLALTAVLFIAVNLFTFWFAGRALHPVKDIVAGLAQMEKMQFHARLPNFKLPEFTAISDTFNRMAQAVEEGFAARERAERSEYELQQSRELTQIIQDHIEEERRNLARELHDELGQAVTAVRTIAITIANRTQQAMPEVAANAKTIAEVSSQMYDAMHGMVRQLRPLALDNLGLGDALRDLISTQQERYPDLRLELNLENELAPLSEELSISAYRIVQECLTNVVRHSAGRNAWVSVTRAPAKGAGEQLEIVVEDDGNGKAADIKAREGHYGVLGIHERVGALGGEFSVEDRVPTGVRVRIALPVRAPAAVNA